MKMKQPQQNIGGDVVGKIPHHRNLLLALPQRRQIHRQHIGLNHLNNGFHRKLRPQTRRQLAIKLNRHQPPRPSAQDLRNRAPARPNLHHRRHAHIAQRVGNRLTRSRIHQKVLPQLWLAFQIASSNCRLRRGIAARRAER